MFIHPAVTSLALILIFGSTGSAAAGTAAGAETCEDDHGGDQDPLQQQDDEGGHVGGVGAVLLLSNISLIIGPGGVGSEHNNRSLINK